MAWSGGAHTSEAVEDCTWRVGAVRGHAVEPDAVGARRTAVHASVAWTGGVTPVRSRSKMSRFGHKIEVGLLQL